MKKAEYIVSKDFIYCKQYINKTIMHKHQLNFIIILTI
jgi:hypothetical protein